MDKEKEIGRMSKAIYETGIAIDGTDIAFGLIDDSHFERMARKLVAEGYGDVRAAVKEFANDLQNAIVINELIRNKDERMVVLAEIEELVKEVCGDEYDELKKKIVEVLKPVIRAGNISCNEENACKKCWFPCEIERTAGRLADALIAAEIGDVKEAEAEANRYEMLYKLQNRDMALAERRAHDAEHRAKVLGRTLAIMKGKRLISGVVDDYIVQAEKELAEENGGKKKV